MPDFLQNISLTEIIIVGIILLVLFGANKVKDLSRGLGESAKELKKVKKELEGSDKSDSHS